MCACVRAPFRPHPTPFRATSQPPIWGRISVIAAQLAPAHFLYQLCADIVVAVIQTAIISLLQMLFITHTHARTRARLVASHIDSS